MPNKKLPVQIVKCRRETKVKRTWQVHFSPSILGCKLVGARRRGRGPWIRDKDLPREVQQYLCLRPFDAALPKGQWIADFGIEGVVSAESIAEAATEVRWVRGKRGEVGFLDIEETVTKVEHREVRGHVIRNLRDLAEHFGTDGTLVWQLNRRIYNDTECGASISIYGTLDGQFKALHNGYTGPYPEGFKATKFTIQTIVEGSDAEVNSDFFVLGFATTEDVDSWIKDMESQADDIWHQANDPDAKQCGMCSSWNVEDGVCKDCKEVVE